MLPVASDCTTLTGIQLLINDSTVGACTATVSVVVTTNAGTPIIHVKPSPNATPITLRPNIKPHACIDTRSPLCMSMIAFAIDVNASGTTHILSSDVKIVPSSLRGYCNHAMSPSTKPNTSANTIATTIFLYMYPPINLTPVQHHPTVPLGIQVQQKV